MTNSSDSAAGLQDKTGATDDLCQEALAATGGDQEKAQGWLERRYQAQMFGDLTEEQEMLRDAVRDFADERVAPLADSIDKEHRYPAELVQEMAEMGLLGVCVPEEYGGAGLDALSYAIAMEELSRAMGSGKRQEMDAGQLEAAIERLEDLLTTHFRAWRKSMVREYVEAVAWAVFLALLIRSFLFEAFSIPSGSMIPTLQIGDRLFVNKVGLGLYMPFSSNRLVHWDEPERGDIVVFEFQLEGDRNDGEDYIKRVVALPGDRVRLEQNRLILNGKPIKVERLPKGSCPIYRGDVDEPLDPSYECPCQQQIEHQDGGSYMTQHLITTGPPGHWSDCRNEPDWPLRFPPPGVHRYFGHWAENANWPDVVVPEGHVFVMGDNRDRSEDGRYWGLVPFDRIKGTAFLVWWARDKSRMFTWLG